MNGLFLPFFDVFIFSFSLPEAFEVSLPKLLLSMPQLNESHIKTIKLCCKVVMISLGNKGSW
jgi:hypothetical protein